MATVTRRRQGAKTPKSKAKAAPAKTTAAAKTGKAPRGKAPARSQPLDLDIDAEVLQFIEAIDRFKHEHARPFPSWSEVLHILRELGYHKA